VEIPPVKGAALDRYLQRRANQLKPFEGEAVLSHQPALPTKRGEAVLLNIFPSRLLDQLIEACRQAQLHLVRVIPATTVLGHQLMDLSLRDDEAVLLAAETGPTTTAVIGRGDARVCLARMLHSTWMQQADRIAVDFTRTAGFAEQQAGLSVSRVILFGEVDAAQLSAMGSLLKLRVERGPVPYTPLHWAHQAVTLPAAKDGNLISLETRQAPQRRRMLKATTVMLILLLLACLGTAIFVELVRTSQMATIDEMNRMIGEYQQRKAEWEQQYAELERKREFVELVARQKVDPVPGWFFAYLGEAVPDPVVLTDLRVARTNDHWNVTLAGSVQGPSRPVTGDDARLATSTLTNNLMGGAFHMEITEQPADNSRSRLPGFGLLPARIRSLIPAASDTSAAANPVFTIEGILR
jgi:hypothetical protein